MRTDLGEPCRECPFRRKAPAGWLGPWEAEELVAQVQYRDFPCHKTIPSGYVGHATDRMQSCAGAALFMLNKCQMPRDPDMARHRQLLAGRVDVAEQRARVLGSTQEFLDHHSDEGRVRQRDALLSRLDQCAGEGEA